MTTRVWGGSLALAFILLLEGSAEISAQDAVPDVGLASLYRLDFAVPDGPAFSLVDIESSDVLRPSSVRELTSSLSGFTSEGSFALPRSFGVELSPGMLIGGKHLSLPTYRSSPWLYRLRVSAALRQASSAEEPMRVALGLRTSILDDSDLRTDARAVDSLEALAGKISGIFGDAAVTCPPPCDRELEDLLGDEQRARVAKLQSDVEAVLRQEDERWNARIMDLAFAVSAVTDDSLGNDVLVERIAGWATYAHGFGTWGQLQLGTRLVSERDTLTGEFGGAASLGSRMFFGGNRYKGFVEAEARWMEDARPTYLLNGGAELKLAWVMWVTTSVGLDIGPWDDPRLRSDFTLRFGFLEPESVGYTR